MMPLFDHDSRDRQEMQSWNWTIDVVTICHASQLVDQRERLNFMYMFNYIEYEGCIITKANSKGFYYYI